MELQHRDIYVIVIKEQKMFWPFDIWYTKKKKICSEGERKKVERAITWKQKWWLFSGEIRIHNSILVLEYLKPIPIYKINIRGAGEL